MPLNTKLSGPSPLRYLQGRKTLFSPKVSDKFLKSWLFSKVSTPSQQLSIIYASCSTRHFQEAFRFLSKQKLWLISIFKKKKQQCSSTTQDHAKPYKIIHYIAMHRGVSLEKVIVIAKYFEMIKDHKTLERNKLILKNV